MQFSQHKAAYRVKLFAALIQMDEQQSGWDKVFQLLYQTRRAAENAQLTALVEQLEEGQTAVLQGLKNSGQFLPWEIKILEVGLASGSINVSYQRLRDHYLLQQKFTADLKARLKPPLCVVLLVITALLTWLVFGDKLSVPAALLKLAITCFGLWLMLLLGQGVIKGFWKASLPPWFESLIKWLPIIKDFLQLGQTYHYLRNLNQCTDSGLPLNVSLKLAAKKIPDQFFIPHFMQVHDAVESGMRLSSALSRCGILTGVSLAPIAIKDASVADAQLHITEAVYQAYIEWLWYWVGWLPQLLYALLPLLALLQFIIV